MQVLQIIGIGIIGAICAIVVKNQRTEFAIIISILTGVVIFLMSADALNAIVKSFQDMFSTVNISSSYITAIIKAIGISYISEFASQICKDAGEGAIALKIEFAGKIAIFIILLPIVTTMLKMITELMPV